MSESLSSTTASASAISGFSQEWEDRYAENTHLSIWPWSDLVSYANRFARPRENFKKVIELGCGAGANIPFFLNRQDDFYAMEGSPTIVEQLLERFPQLKGKLVCGDYTREIPFDVVFDMVVDRASITHNDTESIVQCLNLISEKMRPGGLFVGIDWFSSQHSDATNGVKVDEFTRDKVESQAFHGVGRIHFSTQQHLVDLFGAAGFEIITMEHKLRQSLIGDDKMTRGTYNFIARKN